ncbi:atrial natriuretic peptide receptor 1-like [Paramacrobiotus metropolitanus]|uniref:atrial natriuretic peptide receptor 1-like n=1 Tax=Paramacrobiotus metropolitanus TaxID=2943436 RepID=UPI002445D55D|nr:atrial natriuretic peptide receptor 1-like [Paramacrobiotus metropolitanus]
MGMTNGEYVYLGMETMRNKRILGDFNWKYNDDNDSTAFRAYQSLLLVQPKNVDMAPNFDLGMEFIRRSAREYNFTYNITDQVNETEWIYCKFINESLSRGEEVNYQDGKALARLFLNRSYSDEYGKMYIDNTGQRRTDFVVTYFNSTGIRTPFLTRTGMSEILVEVVNLTKWASVGAEFPPLNEPACGYLNNKPICWHTGEDSR